MSKTDNEEKLYKMKRFLWELYIAYEHASLDKMCEISDEEFNEGFKKLESVYDMIQTTNKLIEAESNEK